MNEDDGFLWVDSAGYVQGAKFFDFLTKDLWILRYGDGVKVYDTKEVLFFVLAVNPLFYCANVVTDVKVTARLDTGENY